jgi:hypothetical protein
VAVPVRLALVFTLLCVPAFAADVGARTALDLRWNAAPGCPDRAAARTAILALLRGADAPPKHPARLRVDVEIAQSSGGRFQARIRTMSGVEDGEREFEGDSCRRVSEAVVLIIAMMLDPIGATEKVSAPGTETATHRAPPEEGVRVTLGVRAVGDLGSLPGPTAAAGLVAGLHDGRLHGEIEGSSFIPRMAARGPLPGSGGEIDLYAGALRGCWDAFRSPDAELGVGPCVSAELGVSTGRGVNISDPARSRGWWGAATVGMAARHFGRSPIASWAAIDVGFPFYRPTYFIEGHGDVFRASPVIGRAAIGVAWIFP